MSNIKTLAQRLEEACKEGLELRADQSQGASLSPACTAFFAEVGRKVAILDANDPVRVALALHETLYTDQGNWQTIHHITQVDVGLLVLVMKEMLEVLCGNSAEAAAAFVAFESFQTGRMGGEPITGH